MRKKIEEALTEFLTDIKIPEKAQKKGIPLVTLVYKEGDKAVLLKALPLPVADTRTEKKEFMGKELLYRVDYFREGERRLAFGVLPKIKEAASFLKLLENATVKGGGRENGTIKSSSKMSGDRSLCEYLKFHLALCALEAVAGDELSLAAFMKREEEKSGSLYLSANIAYYSEVLSYVRTGRDILNACTPDTALPPFPDRSAFMDRWYREKGQGSL